MIVYGVNHRKTGKATYANFSVYVEPTFGTGREIGLGAVADPRFANSARQYLGPAIRTPTCSLPGRWRAMRPEGRPLHGGWDPYGHQRRPLQR